MSSLLAAPSTPAVRKPAFQVSFGGSSADDWARALTSVSVEQGLAPSVDAAEVVLAARPDAPSPSLGDLGSVQLGFGDDAPAPVLSGSVVAVHRTVHGSTRVVASNGGSTLAAFRLDQGYEQRKAGDIVQDLAGQAGVQVGSADPGADLPYYVVDSRSSAWEHVALLAELSGFVAWVDGDENLHFGPLQAGSPAQTFTYGEDVLELDATEATPTAGAVTVVGEGAAGSQGSDAWSWSAKDASGVTGKSGSGEPAVVVQLPAARSASAAQAAADGIAAKAKLGALTARMLVLGAPKARIATTVELKGAPDDTLNGSWLVRGARHRLVKDRGYTTLLLLAKADT